MKIFLTLVCTILTLALAPQNPAPAVKGQVYGTGIKAATVLSLTDVSIVISATVKEVCQRKGCWMIVADGKTKMRVTFKDYGRCPHRGCSE